MTGEDGGELPDHTLFDADSLDWTGKARRAGRVDYASLRLIDVRSAGTESIWAIGANLSTLIPWIGLGRPRRAGRIGTARRHPGNDRRGPAR